MGLLFAKYRPVTCESPGAEARWMDVAAPSAGVFMGGRMNGTSYLWTPPGSSAPKDVRTTPGCSALAVTPLPRNRPDSS